jgi:hypothetical protein
MIRILTMFKRGLTESQYELLELFIDELFIDELCIHNDSICLHRMNGCQVIVGKYPL